MISDDEYQKSSFRIHEMLGKRKSAKGPSQSFAIQDSGLELFVGAVKIQHPEPNLKPRVDIFATNNVSDEKKLAIMSS